MKEVFIIDAIRTPVGRYRGSLAGVRADHLGAHLLSALTERNRFSAENIDDVIFGCVTQVGEQSANIARTSLLGAGWPVHVPGLTIDRKCGSGEAAIHMAAALIASDSASLVVAGGAENMSRVRMGGNRDVHGEPFGWLIQDRYELTSQGEAAERMVDNWGLTRTQLDQFAVASHERAALAASLGYFDKETVPVPLALFQEKGFGEDLPEFLIHDETIRPDSNVEKLATLNPSFRENGRLTAGNSSQISDGASVLLLASVDSCVAHDLKPRAKIISFVTVGSDPTLMLTGPIEAARRVVSKAGLDLNDIDLFEVNEAFAPVPLVWMAELGIPSEKVNVNGGAIALGHPLGASGARIMTSMLNELERRGGRFALQTVCCAGGMATATVVERL